MKCHQYWPNPDSSATYGDFTVTCHNEEGNSAFLVREMTLVHTQVTVEGLLHTQKERRKKRKKGQKREGRSTRTKKERR